MPIIVESLTLWNICFRWFGRDDRSFYFRIPSEVDDLARSLLTAIHRAELACESITLEKRQFEKNEIKESFYYWENDFLAAYNPSKPLKRKLLKWAVIERHDFKLWCERMNAPLPEFWFPKGWNLEYQLPDNELPPGHLYMLKDWSYEERQSYFDEIKQGPALDLSKGDSKARSNQLIKIAVQVVAINLWKQLPNTTIADMTKRSEILDLCGAKSYQVSTIRDWVSEVAPIEVSSRRGRPRKKISANEKMPFD